MTYSRIDRALHRLVFDVPGLQETVADLERNAFGHKFRHIPIIRPVVITSLPRAGTTMLLQALAEHPAVATHTYRDMPFVLAPLLWSRLARPFQRSAAAMERAHGDGVMISYDTPEAFEEVVWLSTCPEKFGPDAIGLWTQSDVTDDLRQALESHLRRILALRGPAAGGGRYVAKNNANIARLRALPRIFPDVEIVVPIREPLAHARSLHRQHLNFRERHTVDPFVERYMRDIGHFEFGALHRPLAFPDPNGLMVGKSPLDLNYWLAYWLVAFEHIRTQVHNIRPLSFESLCAAPRDVLGRVFDRLGLDADPALDRAASFIADHRRAADDVRPDVDATLAARAEALYAELSELGIAHVSA